MCHDEGMYPSAFRFVADRFVDADGNKARGVNAVPLMTFGFGRRCVRLRSRTGGPLADADGGRVCPGRWLALDNIWLTVASILAVYDVVPAKDADGREVLPEEAFTTESVRCVARWRWRVSVLTARTDGSRPRPFKCAFVPRSEAALALIRQDEDGAE